jgi:cation diffusion facilitator CzcD-associated flavoprotein CzcO
LDPVSFDVLIVGAGLSGIGAAYHLQTKCPKKTYAILEAREELGGTWDLFRYPGVRSDSDMFTLGFSFRPWENPKSIADGASILTYMRDTAREYGIDKKIIYRQRAVRASWSSAQARGTVETVDSATGETVTRTCRFLYMCSGYYDYDQGHDPEFPGRERFRGRIVHPQKWTQDVEYEGKRVIVIGSGATAVTLVPELAKRAAHVTMLQRSPTYVVSAPERDPVADWLRARLPAAMAHDLTRWKNVGFLMFFYNFCMNNPAGAKRALLKETKKSLGDSIDLAHFTPSYNPWEQRVCLVPDGDLFKTLREGRATVVTDHIETFTESGIRLKSGSEIEADLIVTATGLKMRFMGGMAGEVDGTRIDPTKSRVYKGLMCSDVPNMAYAMGYSNAPWTLKCELTSEYVCRLINYMDEHGYTQCVPRRNDPNVVEEPIINFKSGYVLRALDRLPKQGNKVPWRVYQNYVRDRILLRRSPVTDSEMEFSSANLR